ncbi:MAG: DPP IV N-terminal domain-containing protein [Rikenellaceae bacterium]
MLKKYIAAALILCGAINATAQGDYASIQRLRSMTQGATEARQMNDAEYFTALRSGAVVRLSYLDEQSVDTLFIAPAGDFSITDYALSGDERLMLIAQGAEPIYRHSYTTRYHLQRCGESASNAIMCGVEATRDATLSPDSRSIAFSSLNNLYLYDIESDTTEQITNDGEWNSIINGTTDWVYEEEFGFTKAYWFSPDSGQIAYLKFDESEVPLFEMMRYDNTLYNKAYSFKYPKAGDTNSTVELWVYNIASKESRKVETTRWDDQYLPYVGYTPAGELYYFRLNRHQNHLEVLLVEEDGSQRMIYEEQNPRYIERVGASTICFIDDTRFVVREESSTGYAHLYHHSTTKGRLNAITSGEWEVTEMITADTKRLYYISTEGSPLRRRIYQVDLSGKRKKQLSGEEGYYSVRPARDMEYFIATYTTAEQTPQTAVYNNKGEMVRMLVDNRELSEVLEADARPTKEFFEITTERGDTLNAYMIRPRDFDPQQRYPLLFTQYSGPGSQQVADRWSLDWVDAMVDHGYIVLCVDPRGTGYRGEEFKKLTYGAMGGMETEDQISAAKYAAALPYVDRDRIGIYGWSYGGFMALNCALRGEGIYAMAIAVAPVTSWRYYDSIYTEVYNGLPEENPAGYDDNSPINYAEKLSERTKLLIIHGTGDDNVHFQNTIEMSRALNAHGKKYDMMIYPDQNHSMMPHDMGNVRQKMIDYTLENL